MAWRDTFQLQNLQQVINDALQQLATNPLSKTNSVKKKRMQQQLQKDIRTAFNAGKKSQIVDLANKEKYLYTTVGQISHFVQVCTEPDFSGLEKLLTKNIGTFAYADKITDYGCGNAVKSSWIYNKLQESPLERKFEICLVDDNDILLQVAQDVSTRLCDTDAISTKRKDIEEEYVVREKNDPKMLHFFLGQTIGNFKDPRPVVENIAKSMHKKEYLVVEWFNRHFSEYEDGRQQDGSYLPNTSGQRNLDFLYNYFEALGFPRNSLATDLDGHFMSEENVKGQAWNIGYLILKDEFTHESGITLEQGTKLIGLRSRRFQEKDVLSLFEKYGLEAEDADWDIELRRRRITPMEGKMRMMPSDFSEMEEVRTNRKKWLVPTQQNLKHQRYALFRKVKEPASRLKVGIFSSILAASLGILGGGYYFGEKVIDCENPKVDYLTITCDNGFGEKLNILDIEKNKDREKEDIDNFKVKKGEIVYRIDVADKEQKMAIENLFQVKQNAQILFESSNPQRCMNWGIQKCGKDENCLEAIVGKRVELTYNGTDPDGDKLTWRAKKKPNGAKLINHGDNEATFSWVPKEEYAGKVEEAILTIDDGRGGITEKKLKIIVQKPFEVKSIEQALEYVADCIPNIELITKACYLAEEYRQNKSVSGKLFIYLLEKKECNSKDLLSFVDLFNRKDVSIPLKQIYSIPLKGLNVSWSSVTIEEMQEAGIMKYDKDNEKFNFIIDPQGHVFEFIKQMNEKHDTTILDNSLKLVKDYAQTSDINKIAVFSMINLASHYLNEQGLNSFIYFVDNIRNFDNTYFITEQMFRLIKKVNSDARAKRDPGELYNWLYNIILGSNENLTARIADIASMGEKLYGREFELKESMGHDPKWLYWTVAYAKVISQNCVLTKFKEIAKRSDEKSMTTYRREIISAIDLEYTSQSTLSLGEISRVGTTYFLNKYGLCEK